MLSMINAQMFSGKLVTFILTRFATKLSVHPYPPNILILSTHYLATDIAEERYGMLVYMLIWEGQEAGEMI